MILKTQCFKPAYQKHFNPYIFVTFFPKPRIVMFTLIFKSFGKCLSPVGSQIRKDVFSSTFNLFSFIKFKCGVLRSASLTT